jgi:hypothetical protein
MDLRQCRLPFLFNFDGTAVWTHGFVLAMQGLYHVYCPMYSLNKINIYAYNHFTPPLIYLIFLLLVYIITLLLEVFVVQRVLILIVLSRLVLFINWIALIIYLPWRSLVPLESIAISYIILFPVSISIQSTVFPHCYLFPGSYHSHKYCIVCAQLVIIRFYFMCFLEAPLSPFTFHLHAKFFVFIIAVLGHMKWDD